MKTKLILSMAMLFGLALTAHAQLLGLYIGRHGFSFGIGLPFCWWGPPAVYAAPAPAVYSPPPAARSPDPATSAAPVPENPAPTWEPSDPLPGHWVPEPNPYRYTPAASAVPAQALTVTKGAGGMLVYSSR